MLLAAFESISQTENKIITRRSMDIEDNKLTNKPVEEEKTA